MKGPINSLKSLSGRLLTGVTAVHVILLPLLVGSIIHLVNLTLKDQFVDDARSTAGLIASTISPNNPIKHRASTAAVIDNLMLSGNVIYAELALPSGQIITSTLDILNINSTIFREDLEFDEHDDQTYFIAVPVFLDGIGSASSLRIGFDEKPITDEIENITNTLLATVFCYILINLVLVYYLGKHTTKPLHDLRQASKMIRLGNTDTQLDVESPVTDVRELATDLNLMRKELLMQTSALKHQATHDTLTGLPNRALLEDRTQRAVLAYSRKQEPFTLLLMDLDKFKEVNDTLGHQAGDEILIQASRRLRGIVRQEDTIARLGGDEFAILLLNNEDAAERVAQEVLEQMQRAFNICKQTLHIGASIGIAHYPNNSNSVEELIRQADIAMYEAKKSDRHYMTYNRNHDRQAMENLTLRNDLRLAIDRRQIALHYQAKVDMRSGDIIGVEALARWQHLTKGEISPERFIAIAESTGMISELSDQLLEIAVCDAASWNRIGHPIEISINLSPNKLLDSNLISHVKYLLGRENLPPELLSLEITENAIIQKPERARAILLTLMDLGVRTIIDDFGTGYSSLGYLRQLPVSEIKIDKSFVIDMINNADDLNIVKAIIRMAHDLDLCVTAEGIENIAISDKLSQLGCDKGQGFLYSKALPVDQFNDWRFQYNRSRIQGVM